MQKFIRRSVPYRIQGYPEWFSSLLHARGVSTPQEAEAYLFPTLEMLHDPMLMTDMVRAVEIIRSVKSGRVVVYGDYDADGVCAVAIVRAALRMINIEADAYIPQRQSEGYGLNTQAVEALAADHALMITVDCGITSVDEVARAKALGMRVIVTDHHQMQDEMPDADAILHPLRGDYPFSDLCGAGVAWKLACALLGAQRCAPLLQWAAIATIADMVPLLGENRAITSLGLAEINQCANTGIDALMQVSGLRDEITSEQVAFLLAPRLNACGRMESAMSALALLEENDLPRALEMAKALDALNSERRAQEMTVLKAAEAQIGDLTGVFALVLCGDGWNKGVVGLAAGKIAEKYARPTVVLSQKDGVCVGSARTACDVNLYQALKACERYFVRFGGHSAAAGLTIEEKNVGAFRQALSDAVRAQCGGVLHAVLTYDLELPLGMATLDMVDALSHLEPFGMGNPAPAFLLDGADILEARAVGASGAHLKLTLSQGDTVRDGIAFGLGRLCEEATDGAAIVYSVSRNEYAGRARAQCMVSALRTDLSLARDFLQDFRADAANVKGYPQAERARLCVTRDELRAVYVALREKNAAVLADIAIRSRLSRAKTLIALAILDELSLCGVCDKPFAVTLLPMRKCEPTQSAIFRALQA